MAVKYVKDFIFGPMTSVQRYAKGGHVTKVPAKAKDSAKGMPARAKPNAPARGAARMESAPKMGKGQGYAEGGVVPGKKMDRLPTKTPPGRDYDLAPAKPFKGEYQGYAKGGKVAKVMGEYKKGELHSGSKKGPLVKNPKQAIAIALSEARKSGAKIAKKAEGGLSDKELGGKSFAGRNEPLRGRYVSREEKIMREAVAKEKQKDMERKMREAYERTQSQSVSGLKKGGMARKAMPAHKAKAMYGGGKC